MDWFFDWFTQECVRHSLGYRDLVDQQSDFEWQFPKNRVLHNIFTKNTNKYKKWRQEAPKVRKSSPRVSKSVPKATKSEPKGAKSEAKGRQREPKVNQNEPKWIKNKLKGGQGAAKMHPKIDVRKRSPKRMENKSTPHLILVPFSIKFRWTNRCENWYQKNCEHIWIFDAKIDQRFHIVRNKRSG